MISIPPIPVKPSKVYTRIAEFTSGADTPGFTLTGLNIQSPQTVKIFFRLANPTLNLTFYDILINGDFVSANYSLQELRLNGSLAPAALASNLPMFIPGIDSDVIAHGELTISIGFNKTFIFAQIVNDMINNDLINARSTTAAIVHTTGSNTINRIDVVSCSNPADPDNTATTAVAAGSIFEVYKINR